MKKMRCRSRESSEDCEVKDPKWDPILWQKFELICNIRKDPTVMEWENQDPKKKEEEEETNFGTQTVAAPEYIMSNQQCWVVVLARLVQLTTSAAVLADSARPSVRTSQPSHLASCSAWPPLVFLLLQMQLITVKARGLSVRSTNKNCHPHK